MVTVVSGQTVNVSFDNVLKRGSLSVVKNAEDSFMSGMRFHLYGTAACGLPVDAYATTDENGVATFTDILISGEEGYSLEEVDTAVRYVTPDIQNVRVFWNETVNAEMSNVLKKFNVIILKQDAEHGSSRGTATLAGAVYGLYRGEELVEQMVTDADGYAVKLFDEGQSDKTYDAVLIGHDSKTDLATITYGTEGSIEYCGGFTLKYLNFDCFQSKNPVLAFSATPADGILDAGCVPYSRKIADLNATDTSVEKKTAPEDNDSNDTETAGF